MSNKMYLFISEEIYNNIYISIHLYIFIEESCLTQSFHQFNITMYSALNFKYNYPYKYLKKLNFL